MNEEPSKTILISGAGVAGLALAHWLERFGYSATVVERAPELRGGGQAVDVRGVALDVVAAMGLLDEARDLRTHLKGMSVLDAGGAEVFRTDERTYSAGRLDGDDIEIFRDDLCNLLLTKTFAAEIVYGDSVTSIESRDAGVAVSFERQATRNFDFVIGADGVRSNVRNLAFGPEDRFLTPLGVGLAFFSAPNFLDLKDWQLSFREAESGYVVYPNRDNSQLRAGIGFAALPSDDVRLTVAAQKALVTQRCAHLLGDVPRMLEAMQSAPDFYFGVLAQVRMQGWSRGRVALLGDAAFCASPFSGQGTSLALVGAFVLASELAGTPENYASAFERYERRMQPFVLLNQNLVDPERQGPIPDELLDAAKNGIVLADLPLPVA
jgi:2-polyprenyl-6-methoxyphenol hydroxylase-like FAD-dependent oxidoreductase